MTPTKASGDSWPQVTAAAQEKRFSADLTLLLVSVIWGTAFVAQRIAATSISPLLFNGLRFLLGAAVLMPFLWRSWQHRELTWSGGSKYLAGVLLAGLVLFGGANLQALGLRYTTAANAGFITGMYVVLVPLMLAVIWRQRPGPLLGLAVFLAAIGLFLLSTGGQLRLARGDALEFVGAFLWAFHVILIGLLVRRLAPLQIAVGQNLVCGLLSLVALFIFVPAQPWKGLSSTWWTIVYTGVMSIGVGYTLQIVGQRTAPPTDAAIILSMEAVFAAIFGWLLLDERLAPVQILGCLFMLAAMLLAQLRPGIKQLNQPAGDSADP